VLQSVSQYLRDGPLQAAWKPSHIGSVVFELDDDNGWITELTRVMHLTYDVDQKACVNASGELLTFKQLRSEVQSRCVQSLRPRKEWLKDQIDHIFGTLDTDGVPPSALDLAKCNCAQICGRACGTRRLYTHFPYPHPRYVHHRLASCHSILSSSSDGTCTD